MSPNTVAKAFMGRTSLSPVTYSMSAPLMRTERQVRVQITIVSKNTSNIPLSPCWAGSLEWVEEWAIGADPWPASLEKRPLPRPPETASFMVMPTAAPNTALGVKARTKIDSITAGREAMLANNTMSEQPM